MKKRLILTVVLASFTVSVGAYYELRRGPQPVRFDTAAVSKGDLVANVVATGTLQAVTTVQVTTQANGIVKEIDADFNSVVHKGEVLARLDASAIQAQIEQNQASIERAEADVQRFQVALDDANWQYSRAQALAAKALVDPNDLETARTAAKQAEEDLKSAQATVAQARAALDQNRVNLGYTVITAPVDGIVIARNVDVGQTVVSTMQAQTLFQIAQDLAQMQLIATIDESDISRVKEGEPVTFTVDAYPGDVFSGTVSQVRVSPDADQNVVSYDTVITVPNRELKLRPGMTANVSVRVASRREVVRVPANALLFKPNDELFAALHEAVPVDTPRRAGAPARGADGKAGVVWVLRDKRLQPVPVSTGVTDGTYVELMAGSLQPGDAVILNVRQQPRGTEP